MAKMVSAAAPPMIAATVGVARDRWRAASRVAMRGVTGSRAASLPASTRTGAPA